MNKVIEVNGLIKQYKGTKEPSVKGSIMKSRESTETYLKAIYLLQQKLACVRSIDVANELCISKPSVSIAIKKLCKEGLLIMNCDHNLVLTEDGMEYAESVVERHVIIENFLTDILDVEKETAHKDACRLEHFISSETYDKIKKTMKSLWMLEQREKFYK